ELLPLADVVTPNLPEAEIIVGHPIKREADMIAAAQTIQELGVKNVIIKGGHRQDAQASDFILLADGSSFWVRSPRIATGNTHGTGDTFSACIAAELAKGESLKKAIITAKAFLEGAISQGIFVGHGHGPTNHWATLSEDVQVSAVKSSAGLQG
ncbi:phosphomethylpyrimidine kinase, partial [Lacticaseibacillus rhamnosus]